MTRLGNYRPGDPITAARLSQTNKAVNKLTREIFPTQSDAPPEEDNEQDAPSTDGGGGVASFVSRETEDLSIPILDEDEVEVGTATVEKVISITVRMPGDTSNTVIQFQ